MILGSITISCYYIAKPFLYTKVNIRDFLLFFFFFFASKVNNFTKLMETATQ